MEEVTHRTDNPKIAASENKGARLNTTTTRLGNAPFTLTASYSFFGRQH